MINRYSRKHIKDIWREKQKKKMKNKIFEFFIMVKKITNDENPGIVAGTKISFQ